MKAMVFHSPEIPLQLTTLPIPEPSQNQVLLRVHTSAICRTDLHIINGDLPPHKTPLILGHQIVGTVIKGGTRFKIGERIGVPWLAHTCNACKFCLSGRENLCNKAKFMGYDLDGGYAEFSLANEAYCHPLPPTYSDIEAAPLLCGGLIGFRAYRMIEQAQKIGFYGFGSSAHILLQVAVHQKKEIYAFTREGDIAAQTLAKQLGATWAGSSEELPPTTLDAALIFAPVGSLMLNALKAIDKGGAVISTGIHMSDIPAFPYQNLYGERSLSSVTNLTREDGNSFFKFAHTHSIHPQITTYPLERANEALTDLKEGRITGSAVLVT